MDDFEARRFLDKRGIAVEMSDPRSYSQIVIDLGLLPEIEPITTVEPGIHAQAQNMTNNVQPGHLGYFVETPRTEL